MNEGTHGTPGSQPERPQQPAAHEPAAPQDFTQQPPQAGTPEPAPQPPRAEPAGHELSSPWARAEAQASHATESGQPGLGQPSAGQPGADQPGAAPYSGGQHAAPGYQPGPLYGHGPQTNPLGVPVPGSQHFQQSQQAQQAKPAGRGRGRLVAGALALVLLGGAVGGGVGSLVAYNLSSPSSQGAANALDTPAAANVNTQQSPAPAGSVEQVAQKVLPAVVQLQVVGQQGAGSGSGVVLSSDGMILTNNHVVEAAADGGKITVMFKDGKTAPGKIVGRDIASDLAVVQAEGVSGLTIAELGASGPLRVGQQVVAIGSPFGLSGTVTTGIVSSVQRPVRTGGDNNGQATVMDAVQTDAAINPGNSGGPLVDMQGKVIGINSAIKTASGGGASQQAGSIGLGFAIPIDQARRIADELRKNGKATHSVLGVTLAAEQPQGRPSSSGAAAAVSGATVGQVEDGSAAGQAGVKVGDVVTKVDSRRIPDADALIAAVRSYAPGSKVKLTVSTGGTEREVEVTLGSKVLDSGR